MQLQSLKLLHLKEEMHLQENFLFDLCPWPWDAKVTQNVAQYLLHHVTYSGTKFYVVTSNNLGDTFKRNVADGRTNMHIQTYKIYIPFLLKKKAGIYQIPTIHIVAVLEHFGHGHFSLGSFGPDILATDISATENAKGWHFGHTHKFWVWNVCMH